MSKICDDLRAAILQAAMQGELINSNNETWNESTIADVCELCTGNSISENVKKTKYMRVLPADPAVRSCVASYLL